MNPTVATDIADARNRVAAARRAGHKVGLVPTMGALHAGHVSLIRAARRETGFVVVSIFVNPTQFGPNEDLARYPRPFAKDLEACRAESVDLVFAPEPATLYPEGFRTFIEVHGLQDLLCGAARPGHFRGVATIVLKLLNIVQPDLAYFGQKDAQQARIIQKLVRDLDVPVEVRVGPIIREPDGLALSSRNQYLNDDQRRQATVLPRTLREARYLIERGERDAAIVRQTMVDTIRAAIGAELDYAAVVGAETLQSLARIHGHVLLALAVRFGQTRLIDNELLDVP
jgi:pantoate--beta-alanine ligase